jgi:S-layer family protein
MAAYRWALLAAIVLTTGSAGAQQRDVPDGGYAFFPVSLQLDPAGNAVLEPNETAVVAPTWLMMGPPGPMSGSGSVSSFSGPGAATYTILDGSATYGQGGSPFELQCAVTGDCYSVRVAAATRPATHWDASLVEMFNGGWTSNWSVHVGGSFADVPATSGFYRFVETVLHRNVTAGCGPTTYCPASSTSRDQMAVFVLAARGGVNPPACVAGSEMFTDVPASSPFCKWVEELARRGVTSGCAPGLYCPSAVVTREQMAVFVLKAYSSGVNPVACGTPMFADVPAASPFCRWIEELVRWGVVSGCGGGNYCPAAAVTREQMSVFLTGTFRLTF